MISTSVTSHSIQPLQQLQQAPQVLSKKRVWHCVAVSLVFILTLSNIISLRGGKVVDVRSEVLAFRPSPSNWSLSGLSPLSVDYENTTSLKEERDTSHKSISLDQGFLDNVTVKPKDGPFPENAPLSNENLSKPSHHQASEWNHALQETTKLLYRDSSREVLDYWLSQPPPKIYIYDTIPDDFSNVERISQCVDQRFLGKNISQVWAGNKKNCQWYPTICQDKTSPNRPKERMFVGYRYNYNMDVAYLAKFHRYPHQTKDPTEADIFVVPYPHKSHCLCHKNFKHYSAKCAVPFKDIETNVLSNLEFFKDSSGTLEMARRQRQRHLFFHGADWLQELKPFRAATSQSMTLSLGPVSPCAEYPQISCGHTAVPYLITDRDYQPHLASEPLWESIWSSSSTSERPYLVGAALSAPKGLPLRAQFLKKWKNWIGESMGGKPHQIINMGAGRGGKKPTSEDFMDLYRNSTVCLILPGDGCAQKRFFDALLNGCIPLVPLFPSNEQAAPYSFHHALGCSTRITYPFSKGTFFQDPSAGFDIMDMVATFNGTCGLACLKSALEELVVNEALIQEKRRKLRDYASVIRFGLTSESDGYPDVFSSLIVSLRHHVWHVLGRGPAKVE